MAWLTGYTYRKSITLSRASGAVTNYQMKLLVGESVDAVGEDVHCAAHCQTDFDDIRFTTSDGTTLLDYWIESVSGATPNQLATIWIEFDSIGTGATTFYMYYGNAGAAAYTNGANTFIVFDDFERGNDGDTIGGSWTEVTAHVHISTDHNYERGGSRCAKFVGAGATYPQATIPQVAADGTYAIQFRIWKEDAADTRTLNHGNGTRYAYVFVQADDNIDYYDVGTVDTGANLLVDQWDLIGIQNINFTGNTYDIMQAGSIIQSGAAMYTNAGFSGKVGMYGYANAAGVDYYIDDYIVRNFRATEPAWGAWGAENGNYSATATDGILLGDTPSNLWTGTVTVTDGVLLGDSIITNWNGSESVTDGILLGDTPIGNLTSNLSTTDGVILGDTPTGSITVSFSLTDGIILGDSVYHWFQAILKGLAKAYRLVMGKSTNYQSVEGTAKSYRRVEGEAK